MKKVLIATVGALLLLVAAACAPEPETSEIHFYNSEGWEEVYATAEDQAGEDLLGEFPGQMAEPVEDRDDWYYVEVPVESFLNDPVTIVFNDGIDGGETSEGATVNHPDFYFLTIEEDGVYGTRDNAEFAMREVDETRVYFYNSEGWTDVRVWAWDDERNFYDSWPGVEATAHEEDDWYYIDVPADISEQDFEIIFNGEDEDEERQQTADIPILMDEPDKVYLTVENTRSASMEDAYAALEEARAQTTVYFYNSEGWDAVYADAESDDFDLDDFTGVQAGEDVEDDWYYVNVPVTIGEDESFTITFTDGDDAESYTATITDETFVYVTMDGLYGSPGSAELFTDTAEEDFTRVYFYNVHEWDELSAYIWHDDYGHALGPWPGMGVEHDEALWYYIDVPINLAEEEIDLIIFNGLDEATFDPEEDEIPNVQTDDVPLDDPDYVYVAIDDQAHSSKEDAEAATEEALAGTDVHFYNSESWDEVYATIESDGDEFEEVLVPYEADFEGWYWLTVPIVLEDGDTFDITFHDGDENESETFTFEAEEMNFVTMDARYAHPNEATLWADTDEEDMVTIYFYNADDWDVHVWAWQHFDPDTEDEIFVPFFETYGWPGVEASEHEEDDWYYIEIPGDPYDAKLEIIFNNNDDPQTGSVEIPDSDHVYITPDGEVFTSMEDAEDHMND